MISIVVPHYCTKKEYFDKCMKSLLNDANADIEVLVIDDGSAPDYLSHLNFYTADKRVRVIQEKHKGVSNARNVGISEASGEWLMFVDSDDYLEAGYYTTLVSLTKKKDADFILFNGYGDKGGKQVANKFFVKENLDYGATLERKCQIMGAGLSLGRTPEYLRCFFTLGSPYAKLIKTSFIRNKNVRFDTGVKFAEDTLFSLNLILNASHIYYADVYLYHYFMNEQSVTGKFRQGLSGDVDDFFKAVDMFMDEHSLRGALEESFFIRAFLEAQRCVRQEFYHKDNTEPPKEKRRAAKNLMNREPYKTGLKAEYPYMKLQSCVVASQLLRKGRFSLYMKMYDVRMMLRKLCGTS